MRCPSCGDPFPARCPDCEIEHPADWVCDVRGMLKVLRRTRERQPVILVDAEELRRYLRWRLAIDIRGLTSEFGTMLHSFGTDPMLVTQQGALNSPGGRGAR